MAIKEEHSITDQDRILAQLALATEEVAETPCPDALVLALLVDGRLSEEDQEAFFNHLARCPSCYEQWRIMIEVQPHTVKKKRFGIIISITGGLLAAAASVMLFINSGIVPTPTMAPQEDGLVRSVPESAPVEIDSMEEKAVDAGVGVSSLAVGDDVVQHQEMEEVVKPSPALEVVAEKAMAHEASAALQRQKEEQIKEVIRLHRRNQSEAKTRQKKGVSPKPSIRKGEMVESSGAYAPPPAIEDPFTLLDLDIAEDEIMLDINRLIPTVVQKVKQVKLGDVVEVKTYKRDRGFSVELVEAEQLLIREYGYRNREYIIAPDKLKRVLKNIVKIEFPRSNKVWLRVTTASGVKQ